MQDAGILMAEYKDTIFMVFEQVINQDDSWDWVGGEVTRRMFYLHKHAWRYEVKHFYEGETVLVWAYFGGDFPPAPNYESGLDFVVRWFNGDYKKCAIGKD